MPKQRRKCDLIYHRVTFSDVDGGNCQLRSRQYCCSQLGRLSPRSTELTDSFLLHRLRVILFLDAFGQNDFAQSPQLVTLLSQLSLNIFRLSTFLTSTKLCSPLDLQLLLCLCAQTSQTSYALSIKLFEHLRIKAPITPAMPTVYLNGADPDLIISPKSSHLYCILAVCTKSFLGIRAGVTLHWPNSAEWLVAN
jgi:hypothetical protein